MLVKRILTAAIAIPVVIVIIYRGSEHVFLSIVMVTAVLSLLEYCEMYLAGQRWLQGLVIAAGAACIFLIYYYQHYFLFDLSEHIATGHFSRSL